MVDPITARNWGYRLLYVLLILLITLLQLLPLGVEAGDLPGPDLSLALTFVWVLRRPSYVPVLLIAPLFLFLDLLLQRPPGLSAALVVLGSEILRRQRDMSRAMPFLVEWAIVTGVILLIAGLEQITLALVMVDRPPLGLALLRSLFTAASYPLVVLVSRYIFNVRTAAPNEAVALGNRL